MPKHKAGAEPTTVQVGLHDGTMTPPVPVDEFVAGADNFGLTGENTDAVQ